MKTKVLAIATSILICVTTALFGVVASCSPDSYQGGPGFYVNGVQPSCSAYSWTYPDGMNMSTHGDGPTLLRNMLTVSPGSILKLNYKPFWFGTKDISVNYFDADILNIPEDGEDEYNQPYPELYDHTPSRLTVYGNAIAPETPGRYIARIGIRYNSYIEAVTGSGYASYIFLFIVE